MPLEINVTSKQIDNVERILLDEGECFDEERREYIRNFETLDLQAVPGSGKTTALLAKLLILEDHLPLNDGGVLVISHTNSAVDEIKDEISAYCPKLFKYPNFVGTIQSFVNKFLAIPFGNNFLQNRFQTIDTDVYRETLWRRFSNVYQWSEKYGEPGKWFFGRNIKRARNEAKNLSLTSKERCIELIEQKVKDLYYDFDDDKLKFFRNDNVLLKTKSNPKYKGLKKCIYEVLSDGIISYRYAYILASNYCKIYPNIIDLLQKRFKYIFVDEMQDMDELQYKLLENLFYQEGNSKSIFQRIGDKNQSIYNGNIIEDEIWEDRETVLTLSGSHRLTQPVADIVNCFAINNDSKFKIHGLNEGKLKPYLLVYDDSSIEGIFEKYAEIIGENQEKGLIPLNPKNPFKVIAWNTEWKDDQDKNDPNKIRLVDYYPEFEKEYSKSKIRYSNLKSYLYYYDSSKKTLASIRKNILNAFLQILKLENVTDEEGRYPTKRRLLNYLKEQHESEYKKLKLKLYEWSIGVVQGNEESIFESIRTYLRGFLEIFDADGEPSKTFINSDDLEKEKTNTQKNNNLTINGIVLEPATVHSTKGQTHTTTLYLESYYQGDYESSRLSSQILGERFSDEETRTYHQHSTLMGYVGLSRPTHLLCLAVHKDRFEKHLSHIDEDIWEIFNVY